MYVLTSINAYVRIHIFADEITTYFMINLSHDCIIQYHVTMVLLLLFISTLLCYPWFYVFWFIILVSFFITLIILLLFYLIMIGEGFAASWRGAREEDNETLRRYTKQRFDLETVRPFLPCLPYPILKDGSQTFSTYKFHSEHRNWDVAS